MWAASSSLPPEAGPTSDLPGGHPPSPVTLSSLKHYGFYFRLCLPHNFFFSLLLKYVKLRAMLDYKQVNVAISFRKTKHKVYFLFLFQDRTVKHSDPQRKAREPPSSLFCSRGMKIKGQYRGLFTFVAHSLAHSRCSINIS